MDLMNSFCICRIDLHCFDWILNPASLYRQHFNNSKLPSDRFRPSSRQNPSQKPRMRRSTSRTSTCRLPPSCWRGWSPTACTPSGWPVRAARACRSGRHGRSYRPAKEVRRLCVCRGEGCAAISKFKPRPVPAQKQKNNQQFIVFFILFVDKLLHFYLQTRCSTIKSFSVRFLWQNNIPIKHPIKESTHLLLLCKETM